MHAYNAVRNSNPLTLPSDWVMSIVVLADGRIISASADHTIRKTRHIYDRMQGRMAIYGYTTWSYDHIWL